MLLLVDIGNTRLKWRCQPLGSEVQGEVVRRGSLPTQELSVELLDSHFPKGVQQIWFASVADTRINDLVQEWAKDQCVTVVQAQTQAQWQDLVNSYTQCSRMGVDRWLVMVAARQLTKQPVCVIDCGSASTLDFVAANGQHEGGYILPGQRLMVQSLLKDTANISFKTQELEVGVGYGTSTAGAVVKGAKNLHQAGIKMMATQALEQGYVVYVTGGDGEFLKANNRIHFIEDLVLDGLWTCLYHTLA